MPFTPQKYRIKRRKIPGIEGVFVIFLQKCAFSSAFCIDCATFFGLFFSLFILYS